MRRPAVVIVILVIAVSFAAAALLLPGCGGGGSTGQAKSLAIKANDAAAKMNDVTSKLTQQFQTLMSETATGAVPDKAKWDAAAAQIKSQIAEVTKSVQEIKNNYQEMAKLNGVPKYNEFAKVQLQILALTEQSIKTIQAFLDKISTMLASGTLTADAYSKAQNDFYNELSAVATKAQSLSAQAKKLRENNKLF
jgi:predicted transcriptional regulator